MGRAIDLFVTYRFLKLLTTPFNKTDAFKFGIIDEKGNRIRKPKSSQVAVELNTTEQRESYTILHKLVFKTLPFGISMATVPPSQAASITKDSPLFSWTSTHN